MGGQLQMSAPQNVQTVLFKTCPQRSPLASLNLHLNLKETWENTKGLGALFLLNWIQSMYLPETQLMTPESLFEEGFL